MDSYLINSNTNPTDEKIVTKINEIFNKITRRENDDLSMMMDDNDKKNEILLRLDRICTFVDSILNNDNNNNNTNTNLINQNNSVSNINNCDEKLIESNDDMHKYEWQHYDIDEHLSPDDLGLGSPVCTHILDSWTNDNSKVVMISIIISSLLYSLRLL